MSEPIKTCPFCGNLPYVAEEIDPVDWWYVACQTPGCISPIAGGRTSIESAIEKWNRRARPAAATSPGSIARAQKSEAYERAMQACEGEFLAAPAEGTCDAVYDRAVQDCIGAVRALIGKGE